VALYDGLTAFKEKCGKVIFAFRDCKIPADFAFGASDRNHLVYILLCLKCQKTLGEWPDRRRESKGAAGVRVENLKVLSRSPRHSTLLGR